MADSSNAGNSLNSILGLKHYVGCDSEWMDYIALISQVMKHSTKQDVLILIVRILGLYSPYL